MDKETLKQLSIFSNEWNDNRTAVYWRESLHVTFYYWSFFTFIVC